MFVNSLTNVNDQTSQSQEAFYYIEDYTNQLVTIFFLEPFEEKGNKIVVFLGWCLIIYLFYGSIHINYTRFLFPYINNFLFII